MKLNLSYKALLAFAVVSLRFGGLAYGQLANGIAGLYYTGANNSGGLVAGGTQESHWSVSYANVNNVANNATYQGAAYVVSSTYIDGGWTPNTTTAQWITAPGANTTTASGVNIGGDSLPGNGTTGANSAYYVYKLAFNISGSGAAGTAVTNQVSITLTIAADDQYNVYVNPASAPTVNNATGAISAGGTTSSSGGWVTNAWNNTSSLVLANFNPPGPGGKTANFVIGDNYLYVVVANTNSKTGTQTGAGSADLNPSGLLVYQVGTAMTIDGTPIVPEVGAWLPVVLALGLFVRQRYFQHVPRLVSCRVRS